MRLPVWVVVWTLAGCASFTHITSEPPGARVRSLRSGAEIGETPCDYWDSATNGNTEGFSIELQGYKPKTLQIRRDQINGGRVAGFLIPGIVVWPLLIGLIWSTDYRDSYGVRLEPAPGAGQADRPQGANGMIR